MAWDSKDNMDVLSFSIAVQPAPGINISILNVSYDGNPTVGEDLELYVMVENIGGDPAIGRLCRERFVRIMSTYHGLLLLVLV